jgi:two-component system chemotaxis response regulator CheB
MYAGVHNRGTLTYVDLLRTRQKVVVIASSAGGLRSLVQLISELPSDFPAPVIVLQHMAPTNIHRSILPELLAVASRLPVKWIENGESLRAGVVYVCPQDVQSTLTQRLTFDLAPLDGECRPSADSLFFSAANRLGEDVIGIVLSGYLSDGACGARRIAEGGGRVFAQNEATSVNFDMPRAAINKGAVDFVLSPIAMAHYLKAILMAPGADAWFRVNKTEQLLLGAEA